MKVTFPHMGNTYILAKALLDDIGVECVIPPYNSKKTLEIGTKYTPEMVCLPLKINIGNYIQAHELGADTILIAGGRGPCRFGYYCEMSKEILVDAQYDMDIITVDGANGNIKEFLKKIKNLTGGYNIYKILNVIKNTTVVSKKVDELEKLTYKTRPRELKKGSTDSIYKEFLNKVRSTKGSCEILQLIEQAKKELEDIEIDKDYVPLKVGIVGEIYTTIDPFANFHIGSILGNMGIEVDREVTVSGWIIEHMLKNILPIKKDLQFSEAAKPYLGRMIGGHAQETIGNTVLYAKKGYDGVVQIYPLTCMPEIVAQSILPSVERDCDMPILTLIIDEMTGEAGYMTRIEAFVDVLNKRRERLEIGKNIAVFRS